MRKLITATGLAVAIVEGFTLSPTSLADSERPGPVELGLSGTTGSREDFRYTAGSETLIPISIEAGAIVVEGSINGHGPFPFIFDTGAQDAMTPETVAALGLQADGTGSIEDSGGHVVAISFTRVGALRLCDAQIT